MKSFTGVSRDLRNTGHREFVSEFREQNWTLWRWAKSFKNIFRCHQPLCISNGHHSWLSTETVDLSMSHSGGKREVWRPPTYWPRVKPTKIEYGNFVWMFYKISWSCLFFFITSSEECHVDKYNFGHMSKSYSHHRDLHHAGESASCAMTNPQWTATLSALGAQWFILMTRFSHTNPMFRVCIGFIVPACIATTPPKVPRQVLTRTWIPVGKELKQVIVFVAAYVQISHCAEDQLIQVLNATITLDGVCCM